MQIMIRARVNAAGPGELIFAWNGERDFDECCVQRDCQLLMYSVSRLLYNLCFPRTRAGPRQLLGVRRFSPRQQKIRISQFSFELTYMQSKQGTVKCVCCEWFVAWDRFTSTANSLRLYSTLLDTPKDPSVLNLDSLHLIYHLITLQRMIRQEGWRISCRTWIFLIFQN